MGKGRPTGKHAAPAGGLFTSQALPNPGGAVDMGNLNPARLTHFDAGMVPQDGGHSGGHGHDSTLAHCGTRTGHQNPSTVTHIGAGMVPDHGNRSGGGSKHFGQGSVRRVDYHSAMEDHLSPHHPTKPRAAAPGGGRPSPNRKNRQTIPTKTLSYADASAAAAEVSAANSLGTQGGETQAFNHRHMSLLPPNTKNVRVAHAAGHSSIEERYTKMAKAFSKADKDGHGIIDADGVARMCHTYNITENTELVKQVVRAADRNRDGHVKFEEVTCSLQAAEHGARFPGAAERAAQIAAQDRLSHKDQSSATHAGKSHRRMSQVARDNNNFQGGMATSKPFQGDKAERPSWMLSQAPDDPNWKGAAEKQKGVTGGISRGQGQAFSAADYTDTNNPRVDPQCRDAAGNLSAPGASTKYGLGRDPMFRDPAKNSLREHHASLDSTEACCPAYTGKGHYLGPHDRERRQNAQLSHHPDLHVKTPFQAQAAHSQKVAETNARLKQNLGDVQKMADLWDGKRGFIATDIQPAFKAGTRVCGASLRTIH